MDAGDWRRIYPPPRRRPGPLAFLVRWRLELLGLIGLGVLWYQVGTTVLGIIAATALLVTLVVPAVRRATVRAWEMITVPHRLRSAMVEAGVAGRTGALPLILWALPCGGAVVRVEVMLRSGITPDDVRNAIPVIRTACGAADADVVERPYRPDRLTVLVVRPRWGLP